MRRAPFFILLGVLAGACGGGGDDDFFRPDARPPECPGCETPNACCEIGGEAFCIAVASDVQNCGGCGMACNPNKANSCRGGQCFCGSQEECGEGLSCCDSSCIDTRNDNLNCGACGMACGEGTTCVDGECLCNGVACNPGEICCNDTCVDPMTDEANCGSCGMLCDGMLSECNGGKCTCPGGGECPANAVLPACCGNGCADLCSDAMNCGMCGKTCAAGCFFGVCFLEEGESPPECVPTFP